MCLLRSAAFRKHWNLPPVSAAFTGHGRRPRGGPVTSVDMNPGTTRAGRADGYPTDSLAHGELAALLRGPAGSALVLTVARPGLAHARAVYVERRPLPQPPVKVASPPPQLPAPCLGLSDSCRRRHA